jgi:hypothetical protein
MSDKASPAAVLNDWLADLDESDETPEPGIKKTSCRSPPPCPQEASSAGIFLVTSTRRTPRRHRRRSTPLVPSRVTATRLRHPPAPASRNYPGHPLRKQRRICHQGEANRSPPFCRFPGNPGR